MQAGACSSATNLRLERLSVEDRRDTVVFAAGAEAWRSGRNGSMAHGRLAMGFRSRALHDALVADCLGGIRLAPGTRRCASARAPRSRSASHVRYCNLLVDCHEWALIFGQPSVIDGEPLDSPRRLALARNTRS